MLDDESGIIIPKVTTVMTLDGPEPRIVDRVWHKGCITIDLLG